MSEKKVIVTDVDGVLLSWQSGLPYFAQKYNLPLDHILEMIQDDKFISPGKLFNCDDELGEKLIEKYNASDFIRYLAPYMDALKQVNILKKEYEFIAVTALGGSIDSRLNRQFNLNALFPGAFKDIYVCKHSASKEEAFRKVKDKYGDRIVMYIDDLAHHVDMASFVFGKNVDMYFMKRGERDKEPVCDHKRATTWDDIVHQMVASDRREMTAQQYRNWLDELTKEIPVNRYWAREDSPLRAYYSPRIKE